MVWEVVKLISAAIFALAISIGCQPKHMHRLDSQASVFQAPVFQAPEIESASPTPLLLKGKATHYDAERNGQSAWYTRQGIEFYGAAGPALRAIVKHEWRGSYRVIITAQKTQRSVVVDVVDYCECLGGDKDARNDRLIDLAPAVWDALGVPLSIGVMRVSIEVLP
jgi:hypothetical protein